MKNRLRSALVCLGHAALLLSFSLFISCGDFSGGPLIEGGITTPVSGSVITSLSSIGGWFDHHTDTNQVELRLTLQRLSDGKFWNGSDWGGSGETYLPVSITPPPGVTTKAHWVNAGPLPSGTSTTSGLTEGHYLITAIGVYGSQSQWSRAASIVSVGIPAPALVPALYSWGKNSHGQLGAGYIPNSNQPVPVFMRGALEGKTIVAVAASPGGAHSLALTRDGVYSWGDDLAGQLGQGEMDGTFVVLPGKVDHSGALAGKQIHQIFAGSSHSFAVDSDGNAYGWGSNIDGELGNGSRGNHFEVPLPAVAGLLAGKRVTAMALGGDFSVALADGELFSWGDNSYGQLGIGSESPTDRLFPVEVAGLAGEHVGAVSSGERHTLALTSDNEVFAFGSNASGKIGDGTTTDARSAVRVGLTGAMAGKKIIAIAAGGSHSLALDEDGNVYAWGDNDEGQIGNGSAGTDVLVPVQVAGALAGVKVKRIEAGAFHSLALTENDLLYTWGDNEDGQLCGATALGVDALVPTLVDTSMMLTGGRTVMGLVSGGDHAMLLTSFPPPGVPEIEVEAQGAELVNGASANQILFGSQANGSTKSEWITVRNVGTSDLSEFDVEISGVNSSDFIASFSSQPPLSEPPLRPNKTTRFELHFKPTATGSRSATLSIRSSDPDEDPFEINVTGTGYAPGKPEAGFNAGLNSYAYTTVVQPDGKILLGGGFTSIQPVGTTTPQARGYIARLNADGTLDTAFHPNVNNTVHSIAVQHDGKILIGGYFTSLQPGGTGAAVTRNNLARLNADGTVDTGFAVNVNGFIRCILPQRDGRILVGGQFYQINDGSGTVTRNRIARLNENGTLDTSFNPNANGEVLTMALDSQNRIVVGGYFTNIGGATRYRLARLDSDGVADGFHPITSSLVYAIAVENDGDILVGGDFTEPLPGGGTARNLLRVKPDGVLDNTFWPNPGYRIQGISLQTDGSILISGSFTAVQPFGDPAPTTRNRMARLFPDGSLDVYFNPDANGEVYGSAIQADGKIVPAGSFYTMGVESRNGTARLSNNTVTDILTVESLGSIQWQRGGGAPETTDVRFDLSTDGGSTWSPLAGTSVRSPTGWEQTGFTLPTSGRIRARARTTSGNHNGSSGLVEKVTIYSDVPAIAIYKDGLLQSHPDSHQYGVVATGGSATIKVFTVENAGGGALTGFTNAIIEDELSEPGDDASNYRLTMSSYPSSLANGESTTIAVRYQPKTTGDHHALLRIPSNDQGQPEFLILLKGTGSLPITTWKQIHFGQTENTGAAADTAKNKAGITRLEAYAQNLNPHTATSDTTSITGPGGGGFAPFSNGTSNPAPPGGVFFFHYQRNKLAMADVQFQVEWSDTLSTNDWQSAGVTEEILSDNGSTQQVKATLPAGTTGRRFVRLKMTRP